MNIQEKLRGAWRRVGEVSLRELVSGSVFAARGDRRKTAGTGSNLAPFFPGSSYTQAGAATPFGLMPKPTAGNLRRFAETPVARRAINVIKDRIAGMRWRIQARQGRSLDATPDGALRARILTENFESPNPDDSFRSLVEQVLEDVIVGGFGAIELQVGEGWGTEGRRGAGAPWSPSDVAGGWGDDPRARRLGWTSRFRALRAGHRMVRTRRKDFSQR